MSLPVFSVIIPIFNASEHLLRSVDSIINQTFSDWELVLVDDGSIDDSLNICNQISLNEKRIKVIHQQNQGVSSARNTGIKASCGQFVTFVDADDWLEPDAFQLFNDIILTYNPDLIKFGYFREYLEGEQESVIADKMYLETSSANMLKRVNDFEYWGYVWNSVYRKNILDGLLFDDDISWLEDHIFTLKCFLKSSTMALIPNPLYHYTINTSPSLSNNKNPRDIYLASTRSYYLNRRIIDAGNKEEINDSRLRYHYFNNLAVMVLYSKDYAYEYKKGLHTIFEIIDKKDIRLYEYLFSIKYLPFYIINWFLKILFLLRRVAKR